MNKRILQMGMAAAWTVGLLGGCTVEDNGVEPQPGEQQYALEKLVSEDENGIVTDEYSYDEQGRVVAVIQNASSFLGLNVKTDITFSYDGDQIVEQRDGQVFAIHTLTEDGVIGMTECTDGNSYSFAYDDQGRLVYSCGDGVLPTKYLWENEDMVRYECDNSQEEGSVDMVASMVENPKVAVYTPSELLADNAYQLPYEEFMTDALFNMGYYGKLSKHLPANVWRKEVSYSPDERIMVDADFTYTVVGGCVTEMKRTSEVIFLSEDNSYTDNVVATFSLVWKQ